MDKYGYHVCQNHEKSHAYNNIPLIHPPSGVPSEYIEVLLRNTGKSALINIGRAVNSDKELLVIGTETV